MIKLSVTANLDATGHRWLAALGAFDFEIACRPGNNNADADSLSRLVTPSIISKDHLSLLLLIHMLAGCYLLKL
jgi:hypothetical protein